MVFDGQSKMESESLGELAEGGGGGGGNGFEFMFDISDLLTDNNIEMSSHENTSSLISQVYGTSNIYPPKLN